VARRPPREEFPDHQIEAATVIEDLNADGDGGTKASADIATLPS
jgi:hypothetical protein